MKRENNTKNDIGNVIKSHHAEMYERGSIKKIILVKIQNSNNKDKVLKKNLYIRPIIYIINWRQFEIYFVNISLSKAYCVTLQTPTGKKCLLLSLLDEYGTFFQVPPMAGLLKV